MLETDDVVMMQTPMNLDLTHQLLLGATLCQGRLGYDFGSRYSLGFQVRELIALGETTLTQEFSSQVFFDTDISIKLYDFFFDDNLSIVCLHQVFF